MASTSTPLKISCNQPVLAMRRDISYAINTTLREYNPVAAAYKGSNGSPWWNSTPNTVWMIRWGNRLKARMKASDKVPTIERGTMVMCGPSSFASAAVTGNMALITDQDAKYRSRPTRATAAYSPATSGAKKCLTSRTSMLQIMTWPIKKTMAWMPSPKEAGL